MANETKAVDTFELFGWELSYKSETLRSLGKFSTVADAKAAAAEFVEGGARAWRICWTTFEAETSTVRVRPVGR